MPEMLSEGSVALDADGEKVVVFVFDHHANAATGGTSVQEAEQASDQQVLDEFYGIADEEQETQVCHNSQARNGMCMFRFRLR